MAGGRPTKYDEKYCELARRAKLLGLTNEELGQHLDVNQSTIYEWMNRHPEFSEAVKGGGALADADIANSLYVKAKGYFKYGIYVPGDTAAMIFWLKNRQSNRWRDKREIEMPANPDQTKTIDELEQEILDLTVKVNGPTDTAGQGDTGTAPEGTAQPEEV